MPGLAETAELAVRISLKDNASAGLGKLQRSVGSLGSSLGRVGKGVGQVGAGIARAGVIIGSAVATGLTLAAKSAIEFEDAFAGVRKTVEGTPAELDEMYGSLRKLATRIPVKFTDLAGIAQEAGALGVARKDVVGFTDVVARLSAATVGLSTEAAAEAFGKLGNVLFTTAEKADGLIEEYNRMGSALVALGNAGASSEGDIIEVAKRFGAAGHAAGLSAAQILGMSSALASLGIEPEAAGGALSRLFNNLTTNLALGNDKAKAFAKTLGLTAEQAKKAFGKDALGTFEVFLKKLSTLNKFQQAKVLGAAGITNNRDVNAIRLLSQQYAEVTRQVGLSTKAYEENVELQRVSAQRFDTLKNKLITLKNLFFDSAVTVASGFTPALGRAADKIREIISQSGNQTALVNIGKDIGEAIDNINWGDVIDGTKTLVGLFKGALGFAKDILAAINLLPGPIKEAGLGFLTLNKLSGGLIGTGLGNIIGGLGETIARSAGSRLPGVGKLFAQPVFVTNWPMGGLGGAGGAGRAGGAGLGLLGGGLALAAVGGIEVAIAGEFGKWLRTQVQGDAGPLRQDHVIADIGPVQFGVFQSQDQKLHELVTGQKTTQQIQWKDISRTERALDLLGQRSHTDFDRDVHETQVLANHVDAIRPAIYEDRDAIERARIAIASKQQTTTSKIGDLQRVTSNQTSAIVHAIRSSRPIVNVKVVSGDTIRITKNYQTGGSLGRTGGQQEFG